MRESIKNRIDAVRRGEVPEGYLSENHQLRPKDWQYEKIGKYLVSHDEFSNETDRYPLATSSRQGLMLQSDYYSDQRYEETAGGFHVVPEGYVTYRHMSDDDIFRFNVNKMGCAVLVSPEYPVFTTSDDLHQDLLIAYLNNMKEFTAYCSAQKKGSTRTRMYFSRLGEFTMPIPSTAEQKKIVEILATCDRAIELKKKLLEEKRRQKQWLMQKLLDPSSGVRLPGFERSEWIETPLSDLCEFVGGGTPDTSNDEYWHGTIPWISSADLQEGNIRCINATRYITEEAVNNSATKICPENSILIVSRVGVGKIAIAPTALCTSQDFINLVDVKGNLYFVTLQLQREIQRILSMSQGTSIKGIASKEIKAMVIELPAWDEQDTIANVLECSDREITLIETEIEAWQQKKKALMQLLLTGLVRVNA